ncbi:hypothetical protein DGMP_29520 [Desulfomarina profundi]|uniref:TIGR00153 family protein n=1 Tax=Desulfomarina profundi TaxID=2772557 RepID=A0A8D5FV56_9BACT|nr:DUF47 family protein [Desulfomarina profundi]BCL62259.1 hypothetical protein DGMP_29520 [Desulfomarina profundi]
MFSFLFKKDTRVEELIYSYLDTFRQILENFDKALACCIARPRCEEFDFLMERTHKYESMADDILDKVNNLMFGKALIPDFRSDIMNLLISLDKIPNHLERTLFMIRYQRLEIPGEFVNDVEDIIRISLESCELLAQQVELFLKDKSGRRSLMSTIDRNESHCDHIERRIIAGIFESGELEPFFKLQFKELIVNIGDITDQADRVSKLINILTLKRRV